MRAVADGALPESEALRLMEAYLEIEHGVRETGQAAQDATAAGSDGADAPGSPPAAGADAARRVHGVEVIEGEGLSLEGEDALPGSPRAPRQGVRGRRSDVLALK